MTQPIKDKEKILSFIAIEVLRKKSKVSHRQLLNAVNSVILDSEWDKSWEGMKKDFDIFNFSIKDKTRHIQNMIEFWMMKFEDGLKKRGYQNG